MKNKKIYGFVLLALIIMLLPIGMVSAKYKQTKEVGSVTLHITAEPPILSPNWYTQVSENATISELIVDSFTPKADSNRYNFFSWDDGKSVGYDSKGNDNLKDNVKLFEKDKGDGTNIAYILAIGKNPVIFPENSSSLFHNGWKLVNVQKIEFRNIDTSNVVDMSNMFYFCPNLKSLDVSSFNTLKVEDMSNMFHYCASLESLDVSSFNTLNVDDMSNMFLNCAKLKSLDVSNFDTSNVTNMANMFNSCEALENLSLSGFNTSRVTDMSYMFNNCNALTSLIVSGFDTSKVTDMSYMFNSCKNLTALNLSSFNTTNVTDMNNMFYDCNTLESLDLSNFNTSNVTNMQNMFESCPKLSRITLGSNFKFVGTNGYLPAPNSSYITGANGKWYVSADNTGKTPAEVAIYQNGVTEPTTYYALKSDIPSTSTTSTFSLMTENGTIKSITQGN